MPEPLAGYGVVLITALSPSCRRPKPGTRDVLPWYAMFGFNDSAKLDDGSMWAIAFALKKLTKADQARIAKLVKQAVS